jgi:hypothetical protein
VHAKLLCSKMHSAAFLMAHADICPPASCLCPLLLQFIIATIPTGADLAVPQSLLLSPAARLPAVPYPC